MTITPCPRGCGAYVDSADVVCQSCRRPLNGVTIMEYRWPGACWAWFGPDDHRMRCRMPEGHAGAHSTHNDVDGCMAPSKPLDLSEGWPTYCEMPKGHDGPHDYELRGVP